MEGKSSDRKVKNSIDIILAISNLNYFNNIEVIESSGLEVVETLRDVLPKDNITRENIDSDDAEDIILNLKEVIKVDSTPKPTPRSERVDKRVHREEKPIINSVEIRATPKPHKPTPTTKIEVDIRAIEAKNFRSDMKREDYEDIMSLPYVQFIEDDKPITVKRHVIDEGTVYIPPSKDDEIEPKDIPWAKLYDINEKTEGILIE